MFRRFEVDRTRLSQSPQYFVRVASGQTHERIIRSAILLEVLRPSHHASVSFNTFLDLISARKQRNPTSFILFRFETIFTKSIVSFVVDTAPVAMEMPGIKPAISSKIENPALTLAHPRISDRNSSAKTSTA